MSTFNELVDVIDTLFGPNGCPWDREQTLLSSRAGLLEEACEVIEAIDLGDKAHIQEELGDLLFNALFLSKLAEKEDCCTFDSVFVELKNKLIRRHPHVFGEVLIANTAAALEQWDEIKKTEKGKDTRHSIFDGIPKGLPALARAQKMLKKMKKKGESLADFQPAMVKSDDEADFGLALLQLVDKASHQGIDAEQALRTALAQIEKAHRQQAST